MSQDEIAVMDGGKCIMQIRGVRPFLSDKFDITKHDQYKKLSDYDEDNAYDIEAELEAWRERKNKLAEQKKLEAQKRRNEQVQKNMEEDVELKLHSSDICNYCEVPQAAVFQ